MMADARAGRFRVLVVWAIDRFGRSMFGNLDAVLELDRVGVEVISVREPWLDTGGPVRSLLIAIFSWVAEQERARIGERTRAGLARARRRGRVLGRPRRTFLLTELEHARRLAKQGKGVRAIAKTLRVPVTTLYRALKGKR
jgi:DNA invertase Pin-like site-specific DNA recombinase